MLRWLLLGLALLAAIPFGWMLGVIAAFLLLGSDIGVFPVLTIPAGWAAGIALAVAPWADVRLRLAALAGGTIVLGVLAQVLFG
jgi:hypothetical protein